MECPVCAIKATQFWCAACVQRHIDKKVILTKQQLQLKAELIATIEDRLSTVEKSTQGEATLKVGTNLSPTQDCSAVFSRVHLLESLILQRQATIKEYRAQIDKLHILSETRAQHIINSRKELTVLRQSSIQKTQVSIQSTLDAYAQTSKGLLRHRLRLVKDLLSIFRLRRVLRRRATGADMASGVNGSDSRGVSPIIESATTTGPPSRPTAPTESSTPLHRGKGRKEDGIPSSLSDSSSTGNLPATVDSTTYQIEYRVLLVGFSIYGSLNLLTGQQREKLNAVVGYALHLTLLLSDYLDIPLPFHLCSAGNNSNIRYTAENELDDGIRPLYSNESNTEAFVTGLALLNYDIAYMCYTQGIDIPFKRTVYLLENLAACCQALELGKEFGRPRDTAFTESQLFDLESSNVIQLHAACWTTGKPWELVSPPTLAETLMDVKAATDSSVKSISTTQKHHQKAPEEQQMSNRLVDQDRDSTEDDPGDAWDMVDEDDAVSS
ncbi:hypothetical protein BASA60_004699 [Batrachochytrium salamandrivorans]|nr:hypothetical protein BASA62_008337 [Batrachochytrium salamandrivorans]KAH6576039.1 hypothetical protein BASA60_004699 [Batrachochytrium salamandrivorans]KAH9266381.1 hypothetical protein BASA83_010623 [Batrachochytrium salamandrivorans]